MTLVKVHFEMIPQRESGVKEGLVPAQTAVTPFLPCREKCGAKIRRGLKKHRMKTGWIGTLNWPLASQVSATDLWSLAR